MNTQQVLDRLLEAYGGYYDIKKEKVTPPFDAEGYLSNEAEQYFLVKAAKVASVNSYEYVFFAVRKKLSSNELQMLDEKAWEEGLSRVRPDGDHKNTDVALIVITEEAEKDACDTARNLSHSKNYKFGLWGFSNYRLVVIETATDTVITNRRGRDLADFVQRTVSQNR